MKKSNITHLTSCNVQPNFTPRKNSEVLFDNVHAFYLPNLTDAQRDKIPINELREGAIILNVEDPDNHLVQVYCTKYPDPAPNWHIAQTNYWIDVIASESKQNGITKLTGLDVQPDFSVKNNSYNVFYMPLLTQFQIYNLPEDELRYGALLYNARESGQIIVYLKQGVHGAAWFILPSV